MDRLNARPGRAPGMATLVLAPWAEAPDQAQLPG